MVVERKRSPRLQEPLTKHYRELDFDNPLHRDLLKALEICQTLDNKREKAYRLLDIANALVLLDLPPEPLLREARSIRQDDAWGRACVLRGIAEVQAKLGKIEEATQTLDSMPAKASRHHKVYGYISLAEAAYNAGQDYTPFVARAQKLVEREREETREYQYLHLAQLLYTLGQSPREMLDKAAGELKKLGKKDFGYKDLSLYFAKMGCFEEALRFIPLIKGDFPQDDREFKVDAIWDIATQQVAQGFFADAERAVAKTGDKEAIADVACDIALETARQGIGAKEKIADALQKISEYEGSIKKDRYLGRSYRVRAGELYATIAVAVSLSGDDPRRLFSKAVELVESQTYNSSQKACAMAEVAKAQARSGIDATQSFERALEFADGIVESFVSEVKSGVVAEALYTMAEQMVTYEDIAVAALEVEYWDILEKVFPRFDKKYDEEFSFDSPYLRVELLAKRIQFRQRALESTSKVIGRFPQS